MKKRNRLSTMRTIIWLGVFIILCLTVVSVYGLMPAISLNSPTSFPVDI